MTTMCSCNTIECILCTWTISTCVKCIQLVFEIAFLCIIKLKLDPFGDWCDIVTHCKKYTSSTMPEFFHHCWAGKLHCSLTIAYESDHLWLHHHSCIVCVTCDGRVNVTCDGKPCMWHAVGWCLCVMCDGRVSVTCVTCGRRVPVWCVTCGRRVSVWCVTCGRRVPVWCVTCGRRVSVWCVTGVRTYIHCMCIAAVWLLMLLWVILSLNLGIEKGAPATSFQEKCSYSPCLFVRLPF